MRTEIEKLFNAFIEKTFKNRRDLMTFFLKHERKKICIDNLCEQIQGVERRRYSLTFNSTIYKRLINDVAKMFCDACLLHQDEKNLSSNERLRRIEAGSAEQRAEDAFEQLKKDGFIKERSLVNGKEIP